MLTTVTFLNTPGGIHMNLEGRPYTVAKSDPNFERVVEALQRKAPAADILDILESEKRRFESAVLVAEGMLVLKGGQLFHDDELIAGMLGERMKVMLDEGFDLKPMAAFLVNLKQNPSKRVVDHLYEFLDHGKCPITEDGHFLVYKAVRADFTDIRTGTFNNGIGQTVSMPRNKVDEDPDRTCSYGLHLCSFEYLPHFSHANGHVIVCKVNPANVVAVPRDYNNTKMRVCHYEVVGEYEGYYQNKGDKLSAHSVASDEDLPFLVEVDYGEGFVVDERFDRLSAAAARLDELEGQSDVAKVRITNTVTGVLVDEYENDHFEGNDSSTTPTFSLYGMDAHNYATLLDNEFESVADAVAEALDSYDNASYQRIEVRNENGDVVKTLS